MWIFCLIIKAIALIGNNKTMILWSIINLNLRAFGFGRFRYTCIYSAVAADVYLWLGTRRSWGRFMVQRKRVSMWSVLPTILKPLTSRRSKTLTVYFIIINLPAISMVDDPHFFGWRTKRSSTVHSPISIMFW